MHRARPIAVGIAIVALVLTACSPGEEPAEPTPGPTIVTTSTEPPLDILAHATGLLVGVTSEGDFIPTDASAVVSPGQGSGIVISKDGLLLVPATSVVGADRINVFIPGEEYPVEGELDAAVECANLALVRVDHTFRTAAVFASGAPPVAVAGADGVEVTSEPVTPQQSGTGFILPTAPGANAGGVLFTEEGEIAGVVVGSGANNAPVALGSADVAAWVQQMRRRDTVEQLGFTAIDNAEGQPEVAAVAPDGPGAELGFEIGDVILSVGDDDMIGGLSQFCAGVEQGATDVEVLKAGRRYIGTFPGEALRLASRRDTEQIRRAVFEINNASGFFISEDGLAVTNFHVAGSDDEVSLRIDGDPDPVPATVVGGSACADIVVLQAAPGEYDYLEWAPEAPELEEPLRVVGFPNFTESISFQDGSVAKETKPSAPWGGLISNFESTAETDGGNSGGPVINRDGEVIGVHYAGRPGNKEGVTENSHLVGVEAREVVASILDGSILDPGFQPDDELVFGRDVHESISGSPLLVDEVAPGGLAADADIEPGDLVLRFGGSTSQDGWDAFASICNQVRDSAPGSVFDVTVWRWWSDAPFDGQIGGTPLTERRAPFTQASVDGSIGLVTPGLWSDYAAIEPADGNDWVGFFAAPDLDGPSGYFNDFGTAPGLRVLWSYQRGESDTTESHFDGVTYKDWSDGGQPEPLETNLYEGHYQWFRKDESSSIEFAFNVKGVENSPLVLLYVSVGDDPISYSPWTILDSLTLDLPVAVEQMIAEPAVSGSAVP